VLLIGSRQIAGRFPAEPAIAVACDPAIQRITHTSGHQAHDPNRAPHAAETTQHRDDRIAVDLRATLVDQQERHRIVRIEPVANKQLAAGRALHRRKSITLPVIVPQQEVHPPIAQHADAIEHDDGVAR